MTLTKENKKLQKIIAKAEEGGYKPFCSALSLCNYDASIMMGERFYLEHSFAKAYWGNDGWVLLYDATENKVEWCQVDDIEVIRDGFDVLREWEYRLQELVIQEKPIDYLVRFLDS